MAATQVITGESTALLRLDFLKSWCLLLEELSHKNQKHFNMIYVQLSH